jgi:hypothetical protein
MRFIKNKRIVDRWYISKPKSQNPNPKKQIPKDKTQKTKLK